SKSKRDARGFREVRFRAARCETARWASDPCRGQAQVSRAPLDFPSTKNSLRLPRGEADKIIDVMKHGERDKNQTIEPVENAAGRFVRAGVGDKFSMTK